MKSRLLLREIFRDLLANKLSLEDRVAIEMAVRTNAHFLIDNHPQSITILQQWCEGYSLREIALIHKLHNGVVKDILRFAFELLGRKLHVDDGSVLSQVPPQLTSVARSVFSAYYDTFTELPERDMEVS